MYFIFDIETTGFPTRNPNYKNDSDFKGCDIVQLAWRLCSNDNERDITKSFIIKRNGFSITNSRFHGITNKISDKEGVSLESVLYELTFDLFLTKKIIAHNLEFDLPILLNNLKKFNMKKTIKTIQEMGKFCTMKESTSILKIPGYRGYKYPKLSELHNHYFKRDFEGAHNARHDVDACARCFFKMI